MERKEQKKHDRQGSVFSSRGKGSRNASYAVHTPPIQALFSLFSCPYKISQQSHELRPLRLLREGIGGRNELRPLRLLREGIGGLNELRPLRSAAVKGGRMRVCLEK